MKGKHMAMQRLALITLLTSFAFIGAEASNRQEEEWHEPVFDSLAGQHLVGQWKLDFSESRLRRFVGKNLEREWVLPGLAVKQLDLLTANRFVATGNVGEEWVTRIYEIRGPKLVELWSSQELPAEFTQFEVGQGEFVVSADGRFWLSAATGPPLSVRAGEIGKRRAEWTWKASGDNRLLAPGTDILGMAAIMKGLPPLVAVQVSRLEDDVLLVDLAAGQARVLERPDECRSVGNLTVGRDALWVYCSSLDQRRKWLAYPLESTEAIPVEAATLGVSPSSQLVSTPDRRVLLVDSAGRRVVELEVLDRAVRAVRSAATPEAAAEEEPWTWNSHGLVRVDPSGHLIGSTSWESLDGPSELPM